MAFELAAKTIKYFKNLHKPNWFKTASKETIVERRKYSYNKKGKFIQQNKDLIAIFFYSYGKNITL